MNALSWNRSIEVRYTPDVMVIGGGPAGCAAAYAAAKAGASVMLVEKSAFLGGLGTAALVPLLIGFHDGREFLVGDFGHELLYRMHTSGKHTFDLWPNAEVIHAEALKRAYDDIMMEHGVQVLLTVNMVDALFEDGRIDVCVMSGKSGLFAVRAKQYVDCTGDGDLCVLAGADYEKGDSDHLLMGGTLCSIWNGVEWGKTVHEPQNRAVGRAYADGVLSQADYHLPGIMKQSDKIANGNTGHTFGVDGTDDESLTAAMKLGRKQLEEYQIYYSKYLPGFENLSLIYSGSQLGIRETRIIKGRDKLVLNDFVTRRKREDEIGRFSYRVDIHAGNSSKEKYEAYLSDFEKYQYNPGETYSIPYGIIQPLTLKNCYVAGRCVSTDRYMQSSIRVMPGCMLTGLAAGFAAAIGALKGLDVGEVQYSQVRKKLVEENVYLG